FSRDWSSDVCSSDLRGNAAQGLAEKDWVHSIGVKTGLTIGLYTDSSVSHNTGISSDWEVDPAFYLAGNNDGHGDYTIGLAFDIRSEERRVGKDGRAR